MQEQVPFKTYFKVCGNVEELGAWNLEKAPMMEWSEGDVWFVDVAIPAGVEVEYKVVKVPRREPIAWEGGPNRLLKVPDSELILKMAFDSIDDTEVVGDVAAEVEVIVPEPAPVEEGIKAGKELVAEELLESAVPEQEVLGEVVEEVAEAVAKEVVAQGVDMQEIVEEAAEVKADSAKNTVRGSRKAESTGKSSSSGATVAAASVVDEEKEKKGIFGGLFGGFGRK